MADDPTQTDALPQADVPPPAAAPTTLEALQDLKAREGVQVATELALRQLLYVLDPHPNDHALTYAEVLGRLDTVVTREREAQERR